MAIVYAGSYTAPERQTRDSRILSVTHKRSLRYTAHSIVSSSRHIRLGFHPEMSSFRSLGSFSSLFHVSEAHAIVCTAVPHVAAGLPSLPPNDPIPDQSALSVRGVHCSRRGGGAVHAQILHHQVELCRILSTRQKISSQHDRHRLITHHSGSTRARARAQAGQGLTRWQNRIDILICTVYCRQRSNIQVSNRRLSVHLSRPPPPRWSLYCTRFTFASPF